MIVLQEKSNFADMERHVLNPEVSKEEEGK